MTREEHLLVILSEECVEVAREVSKALRFGMFEMMPGQHLTNKERIAAELQDLWAAVEMLNLQQVDRNAINRKKEKVNKFMLYAEEQCGTITAPESPAKEQPSEYSPEDRETMRRDFERGVYERDAKEQPGEQNEP